MHCDSLIGEEQRGQPDGRAFSSWPFVFYNQAFLFVILTLWTIVVKAVLHEPPRRVLAPLPFSPISVSDYLFPGQGPADSLMSLADLLDLGTLLEGDVQVRLYPLNFLSAFYWLSRLLCCLLGLLGSGCWGQRRFSPGIWQYPSRNDNHKADCGCFVFKFAGYSLIRSNCSSGYWSVLFDLTDLQS